MWALSRTDAPAPPDDPQVIVRTLAEREPPPSEAARRLAERRESVTRTQLVDAAGIARQRLVGTSETPAVGVQSEGRVEFVLEPAS